MRYKILLCVLIPLSVTVSAQSITELSLSRCLEYSEENDRTLRNAALDVEYARARKSEAFTYYFPSVNVSAAGYHFMDPMLTVRLGDVLGPSGLAQEIAWYAEELGDILGVGTSYSLLHYGYFSSISVFQPVYAGGKIVSGNRLAELGIEAAILKEEAAKRDERVEVEKKYWSVVSLEEKQNVIDAGLKLTDTLYRDVLSAQKAGLAVGTDILLIEKEKSALAVRKKELEIGIRLSKMALLDLLGVRYHVVQGIDDDIPDIDDIRLTDTLGPLPDPWEYYVDPAEILAHVYEYELLDLSVRSHEIQKKIILSEALPQIGAGASYGYGRLLGNPQWNGAVYATLKIPVSDWGRTVHKLRQEDILKQKAVNDRDFLQEQLLLKIRKLWEDVILSWDRLEVAQEEVLVRELTVKQKYADYNAGLSTSSQLLESLLDLTVSRTALADARIACHTALMEYRQMHATSATVPPTKPIRSDGAISN